MIFGIRSIKQKIAGCATDFFNDVKGIFSAEKTAENGQAADISVRNGRIILSVIIVFALFSRLLTMYFEPQLSRDGTYYLELAGQWSRSSFPEMLDNDPYFFIPPLMIYCIQLLIRAGVPAIVAGVVINMSVSIALIPLVYASARMFFCNCKVAVAAAVLTACHPELLEMAFDVRRENFMLFGIACVLFFSLLGFLKNKFFFLLSGFFAAAAFFSRYESMEVFPLLGMVWLAMLISKGEWKNILIQGLLFTGGTLAGVVIFSMLMGIPSEFYYQMALYITGR